MSHPNAAVLEQIYAAFAKGDSATALAACADNCTFQLAGKSRLAGKYNKANFGGFFEKMKELTGNTFKLDVHEIMASDRHGIVLASEMFNRQGDPVQLRTVHVWRFEGGKPVAWYQYPRDLYQFDSHFA